MTNPHDVLVIGSGVGTTRTLTPSPAAVSHAPRQRTDPGFEAFDREFDAVLGDDARLALVAHADAHEGPVYIAREDALYFTTVPRTRDVPAPGIPHAVIKRLALDGLRFPVSPWRLSVLQVPVSMPNGMTLGHDGCLLVCEQGTRASPARISRIDLSMGRRKSLVDHWRGLRLNSPNDIVIRSDGSIWFTDPSYGYLQGFRPEPQVRDCVYRFDPGTARLRNVADCFDKPNGLAFSPDERTIYVTDSGANQEPGSYDLRRPHHIVAFDVDGHGHLRNRRLFAVTADGFPDGIKVDPAGRVYASSFGGVDVYSRSGRLIGRIALPGAVNFTFGGPGGDVLFITTDAAVWAAVLNPAARVRGHARGKE